MADQDNDMKANKEEFTAFLHPEEYDHMKDIVVLVSDTLTLSDDSGILSFTRFLTSYCSFSFFCLQETMEDIDKNGDGLIDLDEYIGVFFKCHQLVPKTENAKYSCKERLQHCRHSFPHSACSCRPAL